MGISNQTPVRNGLADHRRTCSFGALVLLRTRRTQLAIALLAFIAPLLISATSSVLATVQHTAIESSSVSRNAGLELILEPESQSAKDALKTNQRVISFDVRSVSIEHSERLVDGVALHSFSSPVEQFGEFVSGRRPSSGDEIALALDVASALGVSEFETNVTLGHSATFRVVGTYVHPGPRGEIEAYTVGNVGNTPTFLGTLDLYEDPVVAHQLATGEVQGRSLEALRRVAMRQDAPIPSRAMWLWRLAALSIGIIGTFSLLVVESRRFDRAHEGFAQLGWSGSRRLLRTITSFWGGMWAILGVMLGPPLVALLADPLSRAAGQYWSVVVPAKMTALIVLAASVGAVAALRWLAANLHPVQSDGPILRLPRWPRPLLAACVVLVAAAFVRPTSLFGNSLVAGSAALIGTMTVYFYSRHPVDRSVRRMFYLGCRRPAKFLVAWSAVILMVGTTFATTIEVNAQAAAHSYASLPHDVAQGSIVIERMRATNASLLADALDEVAQWEGESSAISIFPLAGDEDGRRVRVVNAVHCEPDRMPEEVEELQRCTDNAPVLWGRVGIAESTPEAMAVRARPEIAGTTGTVALVTFEDDGTIVSYDVVTATHDASLRAATVSAVVAGGTSASNEESDGQWATVELAGFADLSPGHQARVRYLIARLAPTALVERNRGPDLTALRLPGMLTLALVATVAFGASVVAVESSVALARDAAKAGKLGIRNGISRLDLLRSLALPVVVPQGAAAGVSVATVSAHYPLPLGIWVGCGMLAPLGCVMYSIARTGRASC